MPIDWAALYRQAESKIQGLAEREAQQRLAREQALEHLRAWTPREARETLQRVLVAHPDLARNVRTAWPIEDDIRLDQGRCPGEDPSAGAGEALGEAGCPPPQDPRVTIRAADGSQISPDHHAPVYYGLVNLAAVEMRPGQTPAILRETQLYTEADLVDKENDVAYIASMRDVGELRLLGARISPGQTGYPQIGLLDGPLEFWRRGAGEQAMQHLARTYSTLLAQWVERGMVIAGYVDRPRSATVVRMLALLDMVQQGRLSLQPESGGPVVRPSEVYQHWPGLTDATLWLTVLRPGQRSPLFRTWVPVTPDPQRAPGTHPHFFYFRLPHGRGLARVDIPEAVAQAPHQVDLLHRALWHQVHLIPERYYPYVLIRAHEEAVVRYAEREQVEALLLRLWATYRREWVAASDKARLKHAL
ncbi:MAG: DNA double-strand break repair nuclease NurA [Chloroflexi bacterium]|nr:DNA double-strand break repair nuclease NurA [Chloroflexota bacterium]